MLTLLASDKARKVQTVREDKARRFMVGFVRGKMRGEQAREIARAELEQRRKKRLLIERATVRIPHDMPKGETVRDSHGELRAVSSAADRANPAR
jgi:hypothetical protein